MIELDIQMFGGRGAKSSTSKSLVWNKLTKTPEYEAMMKYVDTGRDTDFKDYIKLDNGHIIARAKNGTYSVIDGSKFIVDGEKIPANNKYMVTNSSLSEDLKTINSKRFKKIK